MKAKHIMNRAVVTARPEMTVEEVRQLLVAHHISGLPVVDEQGQVIGVFSTTDAIAKSGGIVGEVMTAPAVTVDQECSIEEVATVLAAMDVNRVPVLHGGRLVGIISRADIVRYVATKRAWHEAR
jgi:CBS domain-containing protein